MDPRDVSNFFALTVGLGVVVVLATLARPQGRVELARLAPILISVAAIGAMAGSLYYSEVADYLPCKLCWYQRIAMYPLAFVMPASVLLRDRGALRYSLLLGSIGLAVSIYHTQLQLFPDQSSGACELNNPCTARWVEAFGFVTIPQMAGATFAFIVVLSVLGLRQSDHESTLSGLTNSAFEPAIETTQTGRGEL